MTRFELGFIKRAQELGYSPDLTKLAGGLGSLVNMAAGVGNKATAGASALTHMSHTGHGANALDFGLNTANGIGAGAEVVEHGAHAIKPLGKAIAGAAPKLLSGAGAVAKKVPLLQAAQATYQTGAMFANPKSLAQQGSEWADGIANKGIASRTWTSLSDMPQAINGGWQGLKNTAGSLFDAYQSNAAADRFASAPRAPTPPQATPPPVPTAKPGLPTPQASPTRAPGVGPEGV